MPARNPQCHKHRFNRDLTPLQEDDIEWVFPEYIMYCKLEYIVRDVISVLNTIGGYAQYVVLVSD